MKSVRALLLIVAALTALSSQSLLSAHGEDRYGPHGGIIRMPGTFHTEVRRYKDKLRVYLLDLSGKNPTTHSSTVSVSLHVGGKKI